jgi:G:T-mismatch repair DNA endonuclease (very short patch repair protein)
MSDIVSKQKCGEIMSQIKNKDSKIDVLFIKLLNNENYF